VTDDPTEGLRARGEEALGEVAQALLENPLFSQALGRALGAGERAMQVQKQALGAFDVATAGDLEQLTRRIRSLSDRLERVEDTLDELSGELNELRRAAETDGPPGSPSS
jgi:chromosome segregation ATPase